MIECKHCSSRNVHKNGKNSFGTQVYKCKECKSTFVEHDKRFGIRTEVLIKMNEAVQMYESQNIPVKDIAEKLGCTARNIYRWLSEHNNHPNKRLSLRQIPRRPKTYFDPNSRTT